MKHSLPILLSLIVLFAGSAQAQSKAAPAFNKLKELVGDWQGKAADGSERKVTYRLASGGSTIIETLIPAGEPEMVSVYHRDGDSLLLAHYCSVGNQPRMRAEVPAGDVKTLDFRFVDATNLKKPTEGHIHQVTIRFQDNNHVSVSWTWRQSGKDDVQTVLFERKK
ncbi:MAG TPA: hypothetical protein PLK30_01165 [Blastocatellia bacterium]|nr:hypothetical protein [Blastocatellia bacterium]